MHPFNKAQNPDGSWIFELGGINLVVNGYVFQDEKHWITNPQSAIAFFVVNGSLYGISNAQYTHRTAEELYDALNAQHQYFNVNAFPDSFFEEYGFKPTKFGWSFELTDCPDNTPCHFEYRISEGWLCNGKVLAKQPGSIPAFFETFHQTTGQMPRRRMESLSAA